MRKLRFPMHSRPRLHMRHLMMLLYKLDIVDPEEYRSVIRRSAKGDRK